MGGDLSSLNSIVVGSVQVTSTLHQLELTVLTVKLLSFNQHGPLILRSSKNVSSAVVLVPKTYEIVSYFFCKFGDLNLPL